MPPETPELGSSNSDPNPGRGEDILRALDSLDADLTGLQEDLNRADRLAELGTLASMVAHEFRNIAAKVAGMAQLAGRHADDPTRVRALTNDILRQGLHAGRIAETILATADQPPTGSCRVESVHQQAMLGLRPEARRRFERPQIEPDTNARIDPDALERVLINLYENACSAVGGAGDGTVRVFVRHTAEDPSNQCSTWNTQNETNGAGSSCVEIRVEDDGPGVDPGQAEMMLAPWRRSVASRGYGLGLALCHQLIQAVGGSLRFEPRSAGACVVVLLPGGPPGQGAEAANRAA